MKHVVLFSFSAFAMGVFGTLSAQNVGIGEAAPAARLEIQAADAVTNIFRVDDNGGTSLFHIGANGAWYVNGDAGTSGQVLVSDGVAGPPSWTTLVGGGTMEDLTTAGSLTLSPDGVYNGSAAQTIQLTGGAADKVTYWTGANAVSYNANFHWDNTNTHLGIGNAAPAHTLHVTGDVRIEGDFVNQHMTSTGNAFSFAPYQSISVNGTTPITNTTVSITINDGDGGPNNSGVLIDATITAGNGSISNNGYGNGAQCILCTTLQRDTDPAFSAPVGLQTHCTGTTFIRAGNSNLQIVDSGGFSYADLGLTNGATYYYRLVAFTGTNYVPTGNQGILAATVTLTQIKR